MATRRYSISKGSGISQVVEAVGAATVSGQVELTFDLAANLSTGDLLTAIRSIEQYILSGRWPPA